MHIVVNSGSLAMSRSLGTSSTPEEANLILSLMMRLPGRVILMVGDSTLRNQFIQLARIGLSFQRHLPVAYTVVHKNHTGRFTTPYPIQLHDKPDSSNGYWGGFPWLIATTPWNTTFVYTKVWGCPSLSVVLNRVEGVLRKQRRRYGRKNWPPDVVLWNFGLHLLHVFPARPVPTSSIMCALSYKQLVRDSMQEIRHVLPRSRLMWRTTNAVCDSRFSGGWAASASAYHCTDDSCATARIQKVRNMCQRRYNVSQRQCELTFMDRSNTAIQRDASRAVLQLSDPGVALVDAYSITKGHCSATADGRHYPRLIAKINQQWLLEILRLL